MTTTVHVLSASYAVERTVTLGRGGEGLKVAGRQPPAARRVAAAPA